MLIDDCFSSEICLKILAHNNLIGRIIGKGGNTIKRIMQETDTKITVSSINDISSFNLERIITVKGTIDNMSRAEAQISAKLRQSYENDLQAMAPQTMMFPGEGTNILSFSTILSLPVYKLHTWNFKKLFLQDYIRWL